MLGDSILLDGESNPLSFGHGRWFIPSVEDQLNVAGNILGCVASFRANGEWRIPWHMQIVFPSLAARIDKVKVISQSGDRLVWVHSMDGKVSTRVVYNFLQPHGERALWQHFIWAHFILPSRSFSCWKAIHGKLATETVLAVRGFALDSMCQLCGCSVESVTHLFLDCSR